MNTSKPLFEIPTVIAHRGLSSEAPENTLASILLAANRAFKWIEVDVKISQDYHLLLCHDEQLKRTTNGSGKISNTTWSDLKQLDAGSWFAPKFKAETLPELNVVLQVCQKHQLGINLELKPLTNQVKKFVDKLLPIIQKYQNLGVPILISSFNKEIIRELSNTQQQITLGYLVDDKDNLKTIQNFIAEINPISIHLPAKRCKPDFIEQLKTFNKPILVYTVNEKEKAEKLFKMGIDSIFSDVEFE